MGTIINAFILFPPAVGADAYLKEDGGFILKEDGGKYLLE